VDSQNKSVRTIQTIRLCMLLAVAGYFVLAMRMPVSTHVTELRTIEIAIALLSLACVNTVFYFNRKYVRKAEALMKEEPDDGRASKRWRIGYLAIYGASFAIALYGLVLHFFGAPPAHVVPFFAVGGAMVLWFRPRMAGH
jgi:hypothetical protein